MSDSLFPSACVAVVLAGLSPNAVAVPAGDGCAASIEEAIAKANARCPESYPELVTPLPEEDQVRERSMGDLMKMLRGWNNYIFRKNHTLNRSLIPLLFHLFEESVYFFS